MEKFKKGDVVICIEGDDWLTKGKTYKVTDLDEDGDPEVLNNDNCNDYYESSCFRLVLRNGKPFKENLDRYMVYGSGCDNKSELYMTEAEMTKEAKYVAKDDEWTGEIIGYKLTPIFKVEVKATLKRLVKRAVKKRA